MVLCRRLAIRSNIFLRYRLASLLSDVGPLPSIQILQLSLNFLLLQQVQPSHFVLVPLLPSTLFLDLLLKITLVVILLPVFNLLYVYRLGSGSRASSPCGDHIAKLVSDGRATAALSEAAKEVIARCLF